MNIINTCLKNLEPIGYNSYHFTNKNNLKNKELLILFYKSIEIKDIDNFFKKIDINALGKISAFIIVNSHNCTYNALQNYCNIYSISIPMLNDILIFLFATNKLYFHSENGKIFYDKVFYKLEDNTDE